MQKFIEICDRCSGQFIPKSTLDFVGEHVTKEGSGSRAIARLLERMARQAKASGNSSLKVLFNGPPGIGKTALALYLQHLLGCDKWSTTNFNGTQLKIDIIEDLARSLHYRGLYGDYRTIRIDEADEIPRVAQVRFLTLLDELPAGVAIVCTSNCKLQNFESRFQSRFQVFETAPPTPAEIESLLADYIDPVSAGHIANFALGNVRQALLDAKGVMQQAMADHEEAVLA